MNIRGIVLGQLKKCQTRYYCPTPWRCGFLLENVQSLCIRGRIKEAIQILRQLVVIDGVPVSFESFLPVVRACLKFKNYAEGIELYEQIMVNAVEQDMVLKNNVMMLYSKCGDSEGARRVFDGMNERNLFSWTAIVDAYLNGGKPSEAYEFYARMRKEGEVADNFLYPCVLKACAAMGGLGEGRVVHADVTKSGFAWDIVVLNSLIDMYAKCDEVMDAREIFHEMPTKDMFSWSSMLNGYVQGGHFKGTVELFREMLNEHVTPCSATLAVILPIFSEVGSLKQGKQIHGLIVTSGFQSDRFVGSGLIHMYAKCGSLGSARLVFYLMRERDAVCWNAMIQGYSQQESLSDELVEILQEVNEDQLTQTSCIFIVSHIKSIQDARNLIFRLENAGIKSRSILKSLLFQIVEYIEDEQSVKEIHGFSLRNGYLSDNPVASSLIQMYSEFSKVEIAREIFNSTNRSLDDWNSMISCYADNGLICKAVQLFSDMQKFRIEPNIVTWNTIISGYIKAADPSNALELLSLMKYSNQKPDLDTVEAILPLIASLTYLEHGKQIHSMLIRNCQEMSRFTICTLINMYANCRHLEYALKLFESITSKDSASWNTIISCLVKNGLLNEAITTFHAMQETPVKPDIVTWTTLITGYVQNGYYDEGLKVFCHLLLDGLKPNAVTVTSILPACAHMAVLSHGKAIHNYIVRTEIGYSDAFVVNALMDMYIKCGCVMHADKLFKMMEHKDVVSWNIMIQGAIVHGKGEAALVLFNQMLEAVITPNSATFVGVLTACSHGGLVDQGWNIFRDMVPKYGVVPSGKHYACMVDLLARAGQFGTVRDFIIQMPLQPTASLWGALLASSRVHGNVEMARYASEHLLELQPDNPGNYVLLSNTYASAGCWNDVDHVRKLMTEKGIRKLPGCSWIEVKDQLHAFSVESLSNHIEIERICECLKELLVCMYEEGYEIGVGSLLNDLEEMELIR